MKLRDRLLTTFVVLTVLGVGGLSIRFGMLEKTRILDAAEHELEIKAFTVAGAMIGPLETFGDDHNTARSFAQAVDHIARPLDARMTVLTLQGDPIYDSERDFRQIENQLDRIEIQKALQGLEQHQIRADENSGEMRLYAAAPIQTEKSLQGVVQLSIPTAPLNAQILQSWLILASTAFTIILLTILASLWLARYILRPITRLQSAAKEIAAGNFNQSLPVDGGDELAELAQAFNTMATQIKEMVEKQRLFVANASHELRTPLTNIKLRTEALLDGARDDPEVSEKFLHDINHETGRMASLTQSLLTLSKLDSQVETITGIVQLCPLLHSVMETFLPQAELKQISLTLDCAITHPLHGNSEQMHRAFDNLVSNAIKYTSSGGTVHISAKETATEIIISVADTGRGIPVQDIPHIFDRFYRVNKARTRTTADPGGTGLGLAIVKSIVQAHGGQINVTSQPEHGTTFVVRLPKTASPQ